MTYSIRFPLSCVSLIYIFLRAPMNKVWYIPVNLKFKYSMYFFIKIWISQIWFPHNIPLT